MFDSDSVPPELWPIHLQRILVVDTDESFVASLRQLMAPHPCSVDWAKDDFEALAMMNEAGPSQRCDVILVDLRMLLKPGSALLPFIRTNGNRLPMIATSPLGYNFEASMVRIRQMGVRTFLCKLFTAEQFFDVVRQAIQDRPL